MFEITPLGIMIWTWKGLLWIGAFCFILGMAGSFTIPVIMRWVENRPKNQARLARLVPQDMQMVIDTLTRMNGEGAIENKRLRGELAAMKRLARERSRFTKYNDSRTHAVMTGHEVD
jgi:hypothetical protein